jgi:hypothetical protein
MSEEEKNDQMGAYTEAVKSGLYAKKTGLVGKYDNVRRYWEDEITRFYIHPHLMKLLEMSQSKMRRLRIMDLGCGSADGFELLRGVRYRNADLRDIEVDILTPSVLGIYKGVDLNEDLLNQAREIYGSNPKMSFQQADMMEGLPLPDNEKPYDLYFMTYGTCSHFNEDEPLIQLLADIAKRTETYSITMCDWLGRYSYEWQTLWTNDLSENRNMDYVVSYIYDKEEREQRKDELQHLYLRLMSRQEGENIVAEASKRAGVEIKPVSWFDRSVFTGRHMDTADYNPNAQPMRLAVNSLHEANMRTDLGTLIVDYIPKEGFDFLNTYFEHLQMCWNTLVEYVDVLLETYDQEKMKVSEDLPSIPSSYPKVLRDMMHRMGRVVEGVGWLSTGLPRENIIEPQLGYALRTLVMNLQQGQGCAHGLVGIFEVDKT